MNVNKARHPSPGGMDSLNLLLNSHNSNEDSGSKECNNKKMALGGTQRDALVLSCLRYKVGSNQTASFWLNVLEYR